MKNKGEKERLINGNRWILGRKKQRIEEISKDGKSDNVNRMKEENCSGGEGKKPKEMIRRKMEKEK